MRWDGVYFSRIKVCGKVTHLGAFKDPKDAALAYDCAANIMHGEFAKTNFPERWVTEKGSP